MSDAKQLFRISSFKITQTVGSSQKHNMLDFDRYKCISLLGYKFVCCSCGTPRTRVAGEPLASLTIQPVLGS